MFLRCLSLADMSCTDKIGKTSAKFRYASPDVDNSKCKVQNAVAPVCKESRVRDFKNIITVFCHHQSNKYFPVPQQKVTREAGQEARGRYPSSRCLCAPTVSACMCKPERRDGWGFFFPSAAPEPYNSAPTAN